MYRYVYDPKDHYEPEETAQDFKTNSKVYERFMRLKQSKLIKYLKKKKTEKAKSFFNFLLQLFKLKF